MSKGPSSLSLPAPDLFPSPPPLSPQTPVQEVGHQHQADQCVDDAAQVLQPPVSPGVPDDLRRRVQNRRRPRVIVREDDDPRQTPPTSHHERTQGSVHLRPLAHYF